MAYQQRRGVLVPLDVDLAGQAQGHRGGRAGGGVEDHRLPGVARKSAQQQARVAHHRGESNGLPALARLADVADGGAVRTQHPHRGVPQVAVFAVQDRGQVQGAAEVDGHRGFLVPVEDRRAAVWAQQVDLGAVLGGPADQGVAAQTDGHPGLPRGPQIRADGLVRAAFEGLPHPDPRLLPTDLLEPPHGLARGFDRAVAAAAGDVRDLAQSAGLTVPAGHLRRPGQVGDEDAALRVRLGPGRQGVPGRAEPLLPAGQHTLGLGGRLHDDLPVLGGVSGSRSWRSGRG